jgi:hypothetical protein
VTTKLEREADEDTLMSSTLCVLMLDVSAEVLVFAPASVLLLALAVVELTDTVTGIVSVRP